MRLKSPIRAVAILGGAALLVVTAALAAAPQPTKFNPADQAAAKAATLRAADFGKEWSGGPQKPDLSRESSCGIRYDDLVLTGVAEAKFQAPGLLVISRSEVLQTKSMVQREWQRTVTSGRYLACMKKQGPTAQSTAKYISFNRIPFARVGENAARYRLIQDYVQPDGTTRYLVDIVFIRQGRTELSLLVTAPHASRAAIDSMEVRLARLVVGRARV